MVTIAELQLDQAERDTLTASLDAWRAAGQDAAVTTWEQLCRGHGARAGSDVAAVTVIPGARRIECLVRDSSADYEALWKSLRQLTSAEWTACVLTSLRGMPRAHEELRGTPVRLQGWWRDEQQTVQFTTDQVC